MAQVDRLDGLVGNTGMKRPVVVATTAAITLSGTQTVDGVAVVADDRVLVKNQASSVNNGIYVADSGAWVRATDCDGAYDMVNGTVVKVNSGTQAGFWYTVGTDPITMGSSAVTFEQASGVLTVFSAFIQTFLATTTALLARQALLIDKKGADIASATTIDLDASTGDLIDITGTTTITTITLAEGVEKTVRFTGSLTLTHGASLVLPDQANIQTAAGDFAKFRGYAAGIVRCLMYTRLNQAASSIARSATTNLDAATGDLVDVSGTTTITAITLGQGRERVVRFTGAGILTHGASLVLPGSANITTASGDFAIFRGYASGVVRCVTYSKADGSTVAGSSAATQAQQETGSSTTVFVSPGRQQYHASSAKAWVKVAAASGTPSIESSYNVTSITDNGVGDYTINFTIFFSAATYGYAATPRSLAADQGLVLHASQSSAAAPATSSCRFQINDSQNSPQSAPADCDFSAIFFGDQ